MAAHYVFLDPDGTTELGLQVIVSAPTGVVYASQCNCLATDVYEQEGFLVPLHPVYVPEEEDQPTLNLPEALRTFFHRHRGCFPMAQEDWTPPLIEPLAEVVSRVTMWKTEPGDGKDEPLRVSLDRSRLGEVVEAWVPVITPYGPGVLVSSNCD